MKYILAVVIVVLVYLWLNQRNYYDKQIDTLEMVIIEKDSSIQNCLSLNNNLLNTTKIDSFARKIDTMILERRIYVKPKPPVVQPSDDVVERIDHWLKTHK
jgi:hypothetical protein